MSNQNWDQVVIHKNTRSKTKKTSSIGNILNKYGTPNSKKSDQVKKSVKEDTGDYSITRVSSSISKQIQKARNTKGISQKELALKINQKSTLISEYESGKAIPNSRILAQIGNVLGVTLKKPKKIKK